jgi:hypothetical protein
MILLPFLMALIYLIARVREMGERRSGEVQQAQAETDRYIKSVAGPSAPADQIASAKAPLDSGAITQPEYEQLRAQALVLGRLSAFLGDPEAVASWVSRREA